MATSQDFVVKKGLDLNGTVTIRSNGSQIGTVTNGASSMNITATANGLKVGTSGAYPLIGVTNSVEVFRADASGNFSIGATPSGERFLVQSPLTGTTTGSNPVARFQSNGSGYDAHLALGDNVNASARVGYLSGNLYFWTNGAERARIDSNGNVGVGQQPTTFNKFSVRGSVGMTSNGSKGTMGEVFANTLIAGFRSNTYYDTGTLQNKATSTGYSPEIQLRTDNGAIVFNRSTSVAADAVVAQAESMRIDSTGNVGVGTTAPATLLHVYSGGGGTTARFQNTGTGNFVDFYNNGGSRQGYVGTVNGTDFIAHNDLAGALAFDTNNTERMRIDAAGNLLVGSTLARSTGWTGSLSALTVTKSSSNSVIDLMTYSTVTNNTSVLVLGKSASGVIGSNLETVNGQQLGAISFEGVHIGGTRSPGASINAYQTAAATATGIPSAIALSTYSGTALLERMRIDSNGNLGVGTISPDVRLSVLGSVRVGTGSPTTGYTGVILASTATDTFTTDTDKVIHHYGITAKEFSDVVGAPSVVLSGYAGLRFYTNGSERLRLDASGNLYLGATPSSWDGGQRAFVSGSGAFYGYGTSGSIMVSNAYYNGGWKFLNADWAAEYLQTQGAHQWFTSSASGTGGTSVTFNQAMTLGQNGNLALGLTSGNLSGYGAGVRVFTVQGNSLPGAIELALNLATGQNNTLGEINFVNNASTVTSKQSAYITGFQDGTSTTAPGGGIRFTTRTDGGGLAERLRITNTGNVGIGTSAPGTLLGFVNGAQISWGTSNFAYVSGSSVTNVLTFGTQATERMRLDATGNVGIGSTNPAYKLHIEGTDPWLAIRDNRTQSAGLGGVLAFQGYTNGVTNPATFSSILGRKENSTSADGAGYLTLFTSNTAGTPVERLRIDSTGILYKTVSSTSLVETVAFRMWDGTNNLGSIRSYNAGSYNQNMRFYTASGTSSSTEGLVMTLDYTGVVILGAGAPRLLIQPGTGVNSALVQFQNAAGNAYVGVDSSSGSLGGAAYGLSLWHTGAYPVVFGTNNVERMRLDANGNLGIGQPAPISRIHVSESGGGLLADFNGPSSLLQFRNDRSEIFDIRTGTNDSLAIWTNNVERMRLDANGNLGIGVTPAYRVHAKLDQNGITSNVLVNSNGGNAATTQFLAAADTASLAMEISSSSHATKASQAWIYNTGAFPVVFGTNSVERMRLDASGNFVYTYGGGAMGYGAGSGGTVTQATSKSTSVSLNKPSGQITLNAASLASNATVMFALNNTLISATDVIRVHRASGGTGASYQVWVDSVAAGTCNIAVRNINASALAEAIVLNFQIHKGATA